MALSNSATALWTILSSRAGIPSGLRLPSGLESTPDVPAVAGTSCVDLCAEPLQVGREVLLIPFHRLSIDTCARVATQAPERALQTGDIDVVQQRGESELPVALCCFVHPLQMRRQGCPALRPDLGLLRRDPFELAPSLRALVSFANFAGTMSQSDSRFRLDAVLRSSLARHPHR